MIPARLESEPRRMRTSRSSMAGLQRTIGQARMGLSTENTYGKSEKPFKDHCKLD